ncbi:hypothetical protein D3C85_1352000 [compost metagenome]
MRRRRLRQDRSGNARRVHCGARRSPGGDSGADHPARPAALQQLPRPLRRLAGDRGSDEPLQVGQGSECGGREPGRRQDRHRHRHAQAAAGRREDQKPRAGDHRRRAPFRCPSERTAQGPAQRSRHPDPDRHADSAHAEHGGVGHARPVDHRHAAGPSPVGTHLRHGAEQEHGQRGLAA